MTNVNPPPKFLFKYFPNYLEFPDKLKAQCQNALNRPYLHCSRVDDFNDPFELRVRIEIPKNRSDWTHLYNLKRQSGHELPELDAWLEYIYKDKSDVESEFKQKSGFIQEKARATANVCCFSEEKDLILMWSHYASKHMGYCLKVDTELAGIRNNLIKVNYSNGDRFPTFTVKNINQDDFNISFGHKHHGWKYEKEWRIICNISEYNYPREAITEVYLGYESDSDLDKELRKAFPSALFKKASIAANSYKLNFKEV